MSARLGTKVSHNPGYGPREVRPRSPVQFIRHPPFTGHPLFALASPPSHLGAPKRFRLFRSRHRQCRTPRVVDSAVIVGLGRRLSSYQNRIAIDGHISNWSRRSVENRFQADVRPNDGRSMTTGKTFSRQRFDRTPRVPPVSNDHRRRR